VRGGLDGRMQPSDVCCLHAGWCRRPGARASAGRG
jgi:hypothetical protein